MNPSGEAERRTPFPGPNASIQRYKFSPDELRVLRECNSESFYQRCVPLSALLGASVYYGIKAGTFKPNPKFGAFPKVAGAITIGYFLGKLSYNSRCKEKLMALPNSKLGETLRAQKFGNLQENSESGFGPSISLSPFGSITDSYSDITPPNRDLDYDSRPHPEGLDDSFRPSVDNPIVIHEEEMPPQEKHVTTYDELRKKNREEYEKKRLSNYRESSKVTPSPSSPTAIPEFSDEYKPSATPKNKYGDIWG